MLEKFILGTAQFGMKYGINNNRKIPKDEVYKILDFCLDNSINNLDTAPAYGDSESIIGEYSKFNNINFNITSKISTKIDSIKISMNESLNKLNSNKIDTFLFHSLESFNRNRLEFSNLNFEIYANNYGISLYTNKEVNEIIEIEKLNSIQIPFNLLDNFNKRGETISKINNKNKKLFIRSIFLQGILFKHINEIPKKLHKLKEYLIKINRISEKYNLPILSLAINYAFNQNVQGVLIGVDSKIQLENILTSLNIINELNFYNEINSIVVDDELLIDPRFW